MAPTRTPLTKTQLLGLVAMALGVLVIANDFTALSVALPHIEREFKTDVTTVQWVINGYALVFGVLIVTGGRLADMFGRRIVRSIGFQRAAAKIGLQNLVYNMRRMVSLERMAAT
ncbi:MAG: MFS transporter [Hyphomicrobium sp.]|nr:MFS transporter [Hyphomicrobium sp.]